MDTQTIQHIAEAVVNLLEQRGYVVKDTKTPLSQKTAYAKTEALLYNYNSFKELVNEKYQEIADLRRYGVPERSKSIVEYSSRTNTVQGIRTKDETVDTAIRTVLDTIQGTVDALAMIDNGMKALRFDPYYQILEMRYFEGRTQEDIAKYFGCSQVTISNNKTRLVKELAMRIFPNQVVDELLQ